MAQPANTQSPIAAVSISRSLRRRLIDLPLSGRVHSASVQACNVVGGDNTVACIVSQSVGNGPLNVVIPAVPGTLADLTPGAAASQHGQSLHIGKTEIATGSASAWDARPDWSRLRAQLPAVRCQVPAVLAMALPRCAKNSLLQVLWRDHTGGSPADWSDSPLSRLVVQAATAIKQGWPSDTTLITAGAHRLAGAGGGLTPAGDDFLLGLMLWTWLAHPHPPTICQPVLGAVDNRTTLLSHALLQAAARGEFSAGWHNLLSELAGGDRSVRPATVSRLLRHGSTSGADALAGFLWLPLQAVER